MSEQKYRCPVLAGDPYNPMRCRVELTQSQMRDISDYHDEVVEETHEDGEHQFVMENGRVMWQEGWAAMVAIESPEYWEPVAVSS